MQRVLITGVSGFAGSHLAEHLANTKKYKIYGTYLSDQSLSNIISVKDKVNLTKIDLSKEKDVFKLIREIEPDIIFHLAALSAPFDSFKNPAWTINNNVSVEINILEAVRRLNSITKILVVSSGDIYGRVLEKEIPIDETTPLRPNSSYAVSKIAQDFLGLQYYISYNIPVIRVRPFNHIGPRQSPSFVVSSFAKKIIEIEKGLKKPILEVGNLDTIRDFTDARDIVEAYDLIIDKGIAGEVYNIGSGIGYKISEILDRLISISGVKLKIIVDKNLFRPSDIPKLICNNKKFRGVTGWVPKILIEKTLQDTLDYWRNII